MTRVIKIINGECICSALEREGLEKELVKFTQKQLLDTGKVVKNG